MHIHTTFDDIMPTGFSWFNEPQQHHIANGLHLTTNPQTDFWQRTHYGFRNDNGHALLTRLEGDFTMRTHVLFEPTTRYDQCGLLVRVDVDNWIKLSTELETPQLCMLGSVVTNLGYSDWATTELNAIPRLMWYQISKNGSDFLLQNSSDGARWQQLRIAHLHAPCERVAAGVYACSPLDGRFTCTFTELTITDNQWEKPG